MFAILENPDNNPIIIYDLDLIDSGEPALYVEALPIPETPAGKTPVLKVDVANSRLWYEYIDAPVIQEPQPEPTQNDRIEAGIDYLVMLNSQEGYHAQ